MMMSRIFRNSCVVVAIGIGLGLARPGRAGSVPPASSGPNAEYALVPTSAKRVRGELTVVFQAPRLEAQEWIVYAARLSELSGQIDVRSAIVPRGKLVRELSDEARPILAVRLPAEGAKRRNEFEVRVEYEATLLARKLVPPKPGEARPIVAALDAKTRRLALAEGAEFDFKSRGFQDWLDEHKLRREPEQGEIDFARRVFLELRNGLKFFAAEKMDRRASNVCQEGKSDGAGMTIALVSALRANGIPARFLAGRLAESSGLEPISKKPYDPAHIKAEFFAQGVGWVPADIAFGVARDESPEGLRYFGIDDGDFVTFHIDTDLVFDTYFGRKTVETLQNPSFWVTGAGSFDGQTIRVTWKVESESVDLSEAASRKPAGRATPSPSPKSKSAIPARPK